MAFKLNSLNINLVTLDFDGLLMDSEYLWHAAERRALERYGIIVSHEDSLVTAGLRCKEVVEYWLLNRGSEQIKSDEKLALQIEREIEDEIVEVVKTRGKPKKGAAKLVEGLLELNFPCAVVSSSPSRIIRAGLSRLGPIVESANIPIFSTESDKLGKPHPSVYIRCIEHFFVHPSSVLAFEDSLNGCIAAKAAKLNLIAVPEKTSDPGKFAFADLVLSSLDDFDLNMVIK